MNTHINTHWNNRVLAFSSILLALELVDQLAKTGYVASKELEILVQSLFNQNPDTAEAVYGRYTNLLKGYEHFLTLLNTSAFQPISFKIKYIFDILKLEKNLSLNNIMLNTIGDRLKKAQQQAEHFGSTHENVLSNIAEIYTETLSTLPFRIQVIGDPQYLQQARIANQIRVLLLAAIRAACLWRQTGGRRWDFFIQTKTMRSCAEQLLADAKLAHSIS